MISWLGEVLDEMHDAARSAERSDHDEISATAETSATDESASTAHHARHRPAAVLARIQAERRIVSAYERAEQLARKTAEPQIERDAAMIWQAASWLAYGHRFDRAGWQPEWAPEGMNTTT